MASLIDTEEEIVADDLGITIDQAKRVIAYAQNLARRQQAEILAKVVGLLLTGKNLPVQVHSLAIAFGLDELNGAHSQSEIARKLGVTRALISHYVIGWRDILAGGVGGFDCTKYRKKNQTRTIYAEKAKSETIQQKQKQYAACTIQTGEN
jgi:predicted transcriptional regulator